MPVNELKDALLSLKTNKSFDYDDISFNVVRNCFDPFLKPLMHVFNLPLEKKTFPDDLKIFRVTLIINAGNENEMRKYRAISVLSSFKTSRNNHVQ